MKFKIFNLLAILILVSCAEEFEKKYREDGTLIEKYEVQNNKKHGKRFVYDSLGRLIEESLWKNGLKEGICIKYSYKKNIKRYLTYERDTLNGKTRDYDLTESYLIKEGFYQNGMRKGFFHYYDSNGDLLESRQFEMDKNKGYFINQQKIYLEGEINLWDSFYFTVQENRKSFIVLSVNPKYKKHDSSYLIFGKITRFVDDFLPLDTVKYEGNSVKVNKEYLELYNSAVALDVIPNIGIENKTLISTMYIRFNDLDDYEPDEKNGKILHVSK
ncbi:MAG: toxin-antitoxin system YwqK family antitoxin [Bacteroidota bacterium]